MAGIPGIFIDAFDASSAAKGIYPYLSLDALLNGLCSESDSRCGFQCGERAIRNPAYGGRDSKKHLNTRMNVVQHSCTFLDFCPLQRAA